MKLQKLVISRTYFTKFLLVVLITINFLLIGIDRVNVANVSVWMDTRSYIQAALYIKDNGGISNFLNLCITGQYKVKDRTPLYLLILSTFASRDPLFFPKAKIVSLIIGFIALMTLFSITNSLYGDLVALIATVLLSYNVTFLEYSSHVAVETSLILFVLLGWYFMFKGSKDNKYWVHSGIFSGLAYMSKGTGIFMIPIFIISNLLIFRLRVFKNKYFWLFLLMFFVVSSPLTLRNLIAYHKSVVAGIGDYTIWSNNFAEWQGLKYYFYSTPWGDAEVYPVPGESLPTASSYLQTHSLSEIETRVLNGLKGEGKTFLSNMHMIIIPSSRTWCLVLSNIFVFALFIFGLIREKDNRIKIYTITTILIFFLFFSWEFPVTWGGYYISPLIPLNCIFSSLGIVELLKYVDREMRPRFLRFNLLSMVKPTLIILLLLTSGYWAGIRSVSNPLNSIKLGSGYNELLDWMKNNIKQGDVYTSHWSFDYPLWLADTPGKRIDIPPKFNNFLDFERFISEHNIPLIIIFPEIVTYHNTFWRDYFKYDKINGLTEKKPIRGWKLIYKHSQKPTEFLIYRIRIDNKMMTDNEAISN